MMTERSRVSRENHQRSQAASKRGKHAYVQLTMSEFLALDFAAARAFAQQEAQRKKFVSHYDITPESRASHVHFVTA
jgi:hypothetical protein